MGGGVDRAGEGLPDGPEQEVGDLLDVDVGRRPVDGRHGDRLAGADPLGVVLHTAGEVVVTPEDMGDAHGHMGKVRVGREHRLGLPLALAVVRVEELRVVPGEVVVHGDSAGIHGALAHRGRRVLVLVHLDGGRHHVPAGAPGEDPARDLRLPRGVADLVDDDVERP